MEGSSNISPNDETRHAVAIDAARRQFERVADRSSASGPWPEQSSSKLLADALPGYEIGPEIHRGGQGVVFKSVHRGTQRDVAIKVMRQGPFGGPHEQARFEREIHILGQLKHPNIVTIHDSGSSAGGFFFVMDYIDGQTLDAYVTNARLGVRDTLRLFAKICHAVNVAHLRGVIHRDLKPANIRVDRAGEPHVLDFGLAKVDDNDVLAGSSTAPHSLTGDFIGSLPWASPEQVEGRTGDIDIRTDVYALGVVLFQILTGRFPYEVVGNVREVLNNICNAEAPAPSTQRPDVDDEVDAIVLKCLQKSKPLRYQSAGELARDVERYLAGDTIEAKRDSGWYVLSKQLRKHRLAVGVVSMFVLVLTAAFVTSLAFWRQAVQDRNAADVAKTNAIEAREEAEKQEGVANSVVGFLTNDVLDQLDPYNMQGEALTARALFDQAAKDVDAGKFVDAPLVELRVRTILGLVYMWMSDFAQAESQFRPALAISRRELGDEDDKTLQTMRRLGTSLSYQGKVDEAEPLLRQALEIQSRTLGDDDLSTIMARSSLGGFYLDAGRPADAEETYRKVLDARMRVQGPEHPNTLVVMSNLAGALISQRKFEEAERLSRKSLEAKRRVYGDDHPEPMIDRMQLASLLTYQGKLDEALPLAREACAGLRKTLGDRHVTTGAAIMTLARVHEALGEWADAEGLLREALEYQRDAGVGSQQSVELLIRLADCLTHQGKMTEAEQLLREAEETNVRMSGSANLRLSILSRLSNVLGEQKKGEEMLAVAMKLSELNAEIWGDDSDNAIIAENNLGLALLNMGMAAEAERRFRDALVTCGRTRKSDDPLTLNFMHNLAISLGMQNKNDERISLLRDALAGRRRILGDGDPMTLKTMHALATALCNSGQLDEAEPLYREAVALAEKSWPDGNYQTEHYRCGLGVCLTEMKRYDEAEAVLLRCHQNELALLPQGHPNRIEVIEKLVKLFEAKGKPDEVELWQQMLRDEYNSGSE